MSTTPHPAHIDPVGSTRAERATAFDGVENVRRVLNVAADTLARCQKDDLQLLAQAHTALADLQQAMTGHGGDFIDETATRTAATAAATIERIILGDEKDQQAALDRVTASLAELRALVDRAETTISSPAGESSAGEAPAQAALNADDAPLVREFIGEAGGHIEAAEAALLRLEEDAGDPEALNAVFRSFHTIKGVAGFLNLVQIGRLGHAAESVLDLARRGEVEFTPAVADAVLLSVDAMRKLIDLLAPVADACGGAPAMLAGLDEVVARLESCASAPQPRSERAATGNEKTSLSGEHGSERSLTVAARPEAEHAVAPASPVAGHDACTDEASTVRRSSADAVVKVSTERLDTLINMVGELVIARAMVTQDMQTQAVQDRRVARNLAQLGKITRELQDLSMSMRMVPIRGVFQKMARLVRDLARKAGKEIELSLEGEETELDRLVVEAIGDPLVHMVRNAADHGIESPDNRLAAGKPRAGHIGLRARHQAGNIVIEITDDGRGLSREKILRKAVENGIAREGQQLSDREVFDFIFAAGLSTAEKVTDISGRGVGMDVVKRNVEALRGRIDIASVAGKGSTFTIQLPLTLAVIDGLVVRVGKERYIIPITSIEQSLRPSPEQISTVRQRDEFCMVRDRLVPVLRIARLFNLNTNHNPLSDALLVIVHDGAQRCCLAVDELLGQQQVVIKSLGGTLESVRGISGGAILGDGQVSLILDIPALIAASPRT